MRPTHKLPFDGSLYIAERKGPALWLPSSYGVAPPTDPRTSNIKSYLCASEIVGSPVPLERIRHHLCGFGTIPVVARLGLLAAELSNNGPSSDAVHALTVGALSNLHENSVQAATVRRFVTRALTTGRPIAHERVLLWLQGQALLHCNDSDVQPSWEQLAWLLMSANDYLDLTTSVREMSRLERLIGVLAREARYNRQPDPVSAFVQPLEILGGSPPEQGRLRDEDTWRRIQENACFGDSLRDFVTEILGPIVVLSHAWGCGEHSADPPVFPVIDPAQWFQQTQLPLQAGNSFFADLSISLADAQARLRSGDLPEALFAMKPAIVMHDGRLLIPSVSLLHEQMRLGLWHRFRGAVRRLGVRSEDWNRAFGYLFETWAREAAESSCRANPIVEAITAPAGAANQVEDVVLARGARTALISVKSSLFPTAAFETDKTLFDAIDRLLFAPRTAGHREGALFQMTRGIQRVRNGESSALHPEGRIFPILLTFEHVPDFALVYRWIRERCEHEGLVFPNVAPITLLDPSDYEHLLAAIERGIDPFDILEYRCNTLRGELSFAQAAMEVVRPTGPLRRASTEREWKAWTTESNRRLFSQM